MKHCNSCDTTKDESEFHHRSASPDFLCAKCKECQREYDRKRANLPHRVKARKDYAKTPEGIAAMKKAKLSWQSRNKDKRHAHVVVGNAIRDGRLERKPCEVCGSAESIHAHHKDYSKPLDVNWLCAAHHHKWHSKNGEGANHSNAAVSPVVGT